MKTSLDAEAYKDIKNATNYIFFLGVRSKKVMHS